VQALPPFPASPARACPRDACSGVRGTRGPRPPYRAHAVHAQADAHPHVARQHRAQQHGHVPGGRGVRAVQLRGRRRVSAARRAPAGGASAARLRVRAAGGRKQPAPLACNSRGACCRSPALRCSYATPRISRETCSCRRGSLKMQLRLRRGRCAHPQRNKQGLPLILRQGQYASLFIALLAQGAAPSSASA